MGRRVDWEGAGNRAWLWGIRNGLSFVFLGKGDSSDRCIWIMHESCVLGIVRGCGDYMAHYMQPCFGMLPHCAHCCSAAIQEN